MTQRSVQVGFIGFGNMAGAIARGLIKSGVVEASQLHACAKRYGKLKEACAALGINPHEDASGVVGASDVVFLAVKPYLLDEVCAPIRDELASKVVVCIAAGKPFDACEGFLAPGTHHISTVPNTPVEVLEGIWTVEEKHSLTEDEYGLAMELLGATGRVVTLPTKLLGAAGTVAGCGPAFTAMFMEALGDAAVKHGIPRAQAYELVGQMVAGTAKLMLETGAHPGAMKDAVCSPGGTTIKGVAALERAGLRAAMIDAIDAIEGR